MSVSADEQDGQRDFVRRLLALRAFDHRDHAVDESVALLRRDADDDAVADSTRVPPVTALRSPPLSRMTGADSPVMAASSTLAMPSIDFAVGGDHVAGFADDEIALAEFSWALISSCRRS